MDKENNTSQELTLCKNVMRDDARRSAFDALAQATFGLSFENWYQTGFWSDSNIPYTLFDGERAVANVAVNRMDVLFDGEVRHYIQLGTVMTDPAYRNRGLIRRIMEAILEDWRDSCHGMFLFANNTVLDFYPKFGFRREIQYRYTLPIERSSPAARQLCLDKPEDLAILREHYKTRNPFSRLQVVENFGLLMFYCGSFYKDCVYYVPQFDAVVIAEREGRVLNCLDVFCGAGQDLGAILSAVGTEETAEAALLFTPNCVPACRAEPTFDDDNALFVLEGKENLFSGRKLLFPEISHT